MIVILYLMDNIFKFYFIIKWENNDLVTKLVNLNDIIKLIKNISINIFCKGQMVL